MTGSVRGRARIWALVVACIAFVGLIALSLAVLRYPVDGTLATEAQVTSDSLTHSVVRGDDGTLTRPDGAAVTDGDAGGAQGTGGNAAQPCPT